MKTPVGIWNINGRDRRVHFIGIGGIGMSALARWFLAEGWQVSGSDLQRSALTDELASEGVDVKIGQTARTLGSPSVVIHTNAVPPANPEFAEAERRKLPLFSYPQVVGELSRRYETIAVAGMHGKSTTTAMLSLIFTRLGMDPTVIVGTKLYELDNKNFRAGKGRHLLLEADEYARAFLEYSPASLIVTNIDREHLDVYQNLMDIKRTFLKLFARVASGGALILNADDPNLTIMKLDIEKIALKNDLRVHWYSHDSREAEKVKDALKIPGRHNVADATAAFTLATQVLELPEKKVLVALGRYRGAWRRYEHKGDYQVDKIRYKVFDDYAHHPTEIRATLAAFREKFPFSALICVFQPHQAERLRRLFRDFTNAFKDADALIFLPAYQVAGREKAESRYTAQALAAAVAKKDRYKAVIYLPRPEDLSRSLVRHSFLQTGLNCDQAVVVMMGAGTIPEYTPLLLHSA